MNEDQPQFETYIDWHFSEPSKWSCNAYGVLAEGDSKGE
jgi:hypothetical protein